MLAVIRSATRDGAVPPDCCGPGLGAGTEGEEGRAGPGVDAARSPVDREGAHEAVINRMTIIGKPSRVFLM
ncbi:MAG: hypothetical protein HYX84_09405 [Chloroflexi bacterium]|nr:hypothetical protein [Chloroflexota bacterium]